MDTSEAINLLEKEMEPFRSLRHEELANNIGAKPTTSETKSSSGDIYQIEISAFWDDKPQGNIRVTGCIDGGGISAFQPLSRDFIKSPDNRFVDE